MALETGGAEWERGELNEAVRWIRRAADAAEAAGDDMRALSLARLAADLKSTLELPVTIMPPRDEAAALASFDDFNDKTIVDSAIDVFARRAGTAAGDDATDGAETETETEHDDDGADRPTAPTKARDAGPEPSRPRTRTAVRVAVAGADPDGGLRVRVLHESSVLDPDESEALLVLLDPDAPVPIPVARAGS